MSITVALYSHDSVGLGHARRNRSIAYALAADLPRLTGHRVRGILIAGHPGATADVLPEGWDWLVLPGFTSTVTGYESRRLDVSTEKLWHLRSTTAAAALQSISPDLLIVDRHPFGVDHELLPVLETLRDAGTRCVLGMREVLDSPEAAAAEWERIGGTQAVAHYYDALWIYGDPQVYNPLTTGEIPAALADRVSFTGYLSHGRPDDPVDESAGAASAQPYVLTMLGGGSDGGRIALAAARMCLPEGYEHLLVTGPQLSDQEYEQLAAEIARQPERHGSTRLLRSVSAIPQLVRDASAVISMGGYNSLAEIMATDTPALIIPRRTRRQEQPRRAAALQQAGAVDTLGSTALSPESLGEWLSGAVNRRTSREGLNLDGLMRIGALAAAQIDQPIDPDFRSPGSENPLDADQEPLPHVR